MLDQRTLTLLNILNNECYNGGYKVFSIDELLLSFPPPFIVDRQDFYESLSILCAQEYVSVKYQDDIEICLSVLSKARRLLESRLESEIEKHSLERRYFVFALLGGAFGGVISFLLSLIFLWVGRR